MGNEYLSAYSEELINWHIRGTSVWASWYTLHKLFSGLIDQYLYIDNKQALEVVTRMGDWAYNKLKLLDEPKRKRMIQKEQRDDLGTKHTNTFIPKVLAEARNYELTQDNDSRKLTDFFWHTMIDHHTFVPGCLCSPALTKFTVPQENSFWCCVGSGFENHAKYGEAIYYHNDQGIYVNLFIPSEVNWKAKGITLHQETAFLAEENTVLTIQTDKPVTTMIYLRYPSWSKNVKVNVNGKTVIALKLIIR